MLNALWKKQIDYVFQGGDPIEPTQYRAHRAHQAQTAGFGGRLFLYLKLHASQTSQIDAVWLQLMSDLIEHSTGHASPKVDDANSDQKKPL